MSIILAPSLLSADFSNLAKDIAMINQSQADWFHVDIMDGNFVPNLSFGFPVLKAIQKCATKPLDVHLMILDPDRYIQAFRDAGAHIITVHYEACTHLHRTIQLIKSIGVKAGVALNPHTPVHMLDSIIEDLDLVLMMSVNPGFGGQKFIPNSINKLHEIKDMVTSRNLKPYIEIDGGIDLKNAKSVINAGANVLVAGNSVFSSANPSKTIEEFKLY
jgi:ribulose-phosphate 3-epimerase